MGGDEGGRRGKGRRDEMRKEVKVGEETRKI